MTKILFIVSFPKNVSPSTRFRVEIYEQLLVENGFDCQYSFFWDEKGSKILYKKGHLINKGIGLLMGFWRRMKTLFVVHRFDFVFILRETTPIGPPFFEWAYTKVFKKKIIYDFDDAIWVNQAQGSNAWARSLKAFWKVKVICKLAHRVSVGNLYLYNYAIKYNANTVINPTCVDTDNRHNLIKCQHTKRVVIGWTGSFSQLICLNQVIEVLQELEKQYVFEFIVIADKNPNLPLRYYRFIQWDETTEITDLLNINIGIMPLPDDEFSKGKCGFKLIQFMSLGIPVVTSPIGVNSTIVDEKVNGFLCQTKQEWFNALEKLLTDPQLRIQYGAIGRQTIIKDYSLESNKGKILSLFH